MSSSTAFCGVMGSRSVDLVALDMDELLSATQGFLSSLHAANETGDYVSRRSWQLRSARKVGAGRYYRSGDWPVASARVGGQTPVWCASAHSWDCPGRSLPG